jgi:hypothetical protein
MGSRFHDTVWRYWAATVLLLAVGVLGQPGAFRLAIGLTALQALHFWLREGRVGALRVQVRLAYLAVLLPGQWAPAIYWLPLLGTLAMVLFDYCLLARTLSLLPWNRRAPLSWALVRKAFLSRPVQGSILTHLAGGGA